MIDSKLCKELEKLLSCMIVARKARPKNQSVNLCYRVPRDTFPRFAWILQSNQKKARWHVLFTCDAFPGTWARSLAPATTLSPTPCSFQDLLFENPKPCLPASKQISPKLRAKVGQSSSESSTAAAQTRGGGLRTCRGFTGATSSSGTVIRFARLFLVEGDGDPLWALRRLVIAATSNCIRVFGRGNRDAVSCSVGPHTSLSWIQKYPTERVFRGFEDLKFLSMAGTHCLYIRHDEGFWKTFKHRKRVYVLNCLPFPPLE